jgi:hypothetical protein
MTTNQPILLLNFSTAFNLILEFYSISNLNITDSLFFIKNWVFLIKFMITDRKKVLNSFESSFIHCKLTSK